MSQGALIENIKRKVGEVVADNRRLREECAKVRRASETVRADNNALQERIGELERRLGVLELSASMGGNAQQRKLARARVTRLLREVDRCIALVNK